MTLKEYHDLLPQVVADNMGNLKGAEDFAKQLVDNADEEKLFEAQQVVGMVAERMAQVDRMVSGLQNTIHQLALALHSNDGF
jgi:hypothetical protein